MGLVDSRVAFVTGAARGMGRNHAVRFARPATTSRSGSSASAVPGAELTKRTLWTSLDASSLAGHMEYEGIAQLFARMTTHNFDEAILARQAKRSPVFLD